ncbi:zinc finger (C2H2 type) family protein [Striga hermonthica]|uniref:Zinc finger (C2H2 type) family protein n=1 Tax=Striga hermonthica TaxID=68872 RepID=A0A9N7NJU6_STRHE|nr:zinc finger (C2H2 type) family protein [Striga hermonthica]
MGGKCPHRSVKKRRYSHKTARRTKFLVKDILFIAFMWIFNQCFCFVVIVRNHACFFLTCDCLRDDAVYDELQKVEGKSKSMPVDEDLPGMGQYYCLHCDRYFANVTVRDEHFKTKRHKKRLKLMMGPAPHTQLDAELAAGMDIDIFKRCLQGFL